MESESENKMKITDSSVEKKSGKFFAEAKRFRQLGDKIDKGDGNKIKYYSTALSLLYKIIFDSLNKEPFPREHIDCLYEIADLNYNLGWCWSKKDKEKSVKFFEKSAFYYKYLGGIYAKLNDSDKNKYTKASEFFLKESELANKVIEQLKSPVIGIDKKRKREGEIHIAKKERLPRMIISIQDELDKVSLKIIEKIKDAKEINKYPGAKYPDSSYRIIDPYDDGSNKKSL